MVSKVACFPSVFTLCGRDVQSYNSEHFPSGAFQHVPDPTAVDEDGDPQTLYAPHWGSVRPFGYERNDIIPNYLPSPLELAYQGNLTEVKKIGTTLWVSDSTFSVSLPSTAE